VVPVKDVENVTQYVAWDFQFVTYVTVQWRGASTDSKRFGLVTRTIDA
jgi:hypothetical protein